MIYFDNAASSYKKPLKVKFGVWYSMYKYTANPGRSGHKESIKVLNEIFKTRVIISKFFNSKNEGDVLFFESCTQALNQAIIGGVKKNGHIIISALEHNSVLRTVNSLVKSHKITFSIVYPNKSGYIDINSIKKLINNKTYMLIINHISNVVGVEQDIDKIGKLCNENNIIFLLDSAQSAGHKKIDMKRSHIDMLAFAGHKGLHGIQGVGGLVINADIKLLPIFFGGTGTESENLVQPESRPEGLESGTLPTPAILALKDAINYTDKHFYENCLKVQKLTKYLLKNLEQIENIVIYTDKKCLNGVVSFNISGVDSRVVADILSRDYNICVRSGLHCSPLTHKFYGTTEQGMVRVSIDYYNKINEVDKFIVAIKKIVNMKII